MLNDRIGNLRKKIIDVLFILLETDMPFYYDMPDEKFIELFDLQFKKIDLSKPSWNIYPIKRTNLINFYINNEISSRIGSARIPVDREAFLFLENIGKRFAYDVIKKSKVLNNFKRSLIFLSVIILLSIIFIPLRSFVQHYDFCFLIFIMSGAIFALYFQVKTIWVAVYE